MKRSGSDPSNPGIDTHDFETTSPPSGRKSELNKGGGCPFRGLRKNHDRNPPKNFRRELSKGGGGKSGGGGLSRNRVYLGYFFWKCKTKM